LQKFHANVDLDGGAFLGMNGEMDDLPLLVWFIVPLHKKWSHATFSQNKCPMQQEFFEHEVSCVLDIGCFHSNPNMPIILFIHAMHATPNGWGFGINFDW
jgi:hypothetical protein